jgi:hypothetical protein
MIVTSKRRGRMKKLFVGMAVLLAFGMMAVSAMAGVGNEMPSGPHYNLNIIGAKTDKDVGDSNGHTLFVRLEGKTRIYMTQDQDGEFKVVDRNGVDEGEPWGEAEFNIGDSDPTDARTHYLAFARALGKPGKEVTITPGAEFEGDESGLFFYLGPITIKRNTGKPATVDITKIFYVDVDIYVSGILTASYQREWVFDIPELLEYYWDYDNKGLKLLQVRFYEGEPDWDAAPAKVGPTTTWAAIKSR